MSSNAEDTAPADNLPPPEAGLKPLNYREQFSVRVSSFAPNGEFDVSAQGRHVTSQFIEFVFTLY
jgi:hypothetical protein